MKLFKAIGLFIAQKISEIVKFTFPFCKLIGYIVFGIFAGFLAILALCSALAIFGLLMHAMLGDKLFFAIMGKTVVQLNNIRFAELWAIYALYGMIYALQLTLMFLIGSLFYIWIKSGNFIKRIDYAIIMLPVFIRANWYKANIKSGRKRYFVVIHKWDSHYTKSAKIWIKKEIYTKDNLHKSPKIRERYMKISELSVNDCDNATFPYFYYKVHLYYEFGLLYRFIKKRKRKLKND